MSQFIRNMILREIEKNGRIDGSPTINFEDRKIAFTGEDIYVADNWVWSLTGISAYYLPLPPNTYGVVIYPDGSIHNKAGGLHEAPPGSYKIQYVDKHERFDFTDPTSELARDGEKLTLRVLVRYHVIDPLIALRIDRPVETLMEHIQMDLAQYIRTHNHNDIADHAEARAMGKIHQFFIERHANRHPLSRAIAILGIELKEFTGDMEFVNLRRSTLTQQRQDQIERDQLDRKKEIERLKAEHKMALDKLNAKATAEIATLLRETQKQDILLEDMRTQAQRRQDLLVKAVDAVSLALEHSSYSRNPGEIKNAISNLLDAIKETSPTIEQPSTKNESAGNSQPPSTGNEKIEGLTNTLLNLLNPKK